MTDDNNKRTADSSDDVDGGVSTSDRKRAKLLTTSSTPDDDDFVDEYLGYQFPPSSSKPPTIDRVDASDLTPQSFYDEYVKKRKPVVITSLTTSKWVNVGDDGLRGVGLLDSSSFFTADGKLTKNDADGTTKKKWRVSDRWTDLSYLKTKVADDVEVKVEQRAEGSNSKFGKGNEVTMKFHSFLDLLQESKGDRYYLTTQDVTAGANGRPKIMSSLMECLQEDFPFRPALMGNLIPQNINVWMGGHSSSSSSHSDSGGERGGSSSGLHHDYHDNLYVVVSGQKKFDLYAPSDAPNLYTRGKLTRIHPNGRINYAGEETNADGSHKDSERALDASLRRDQAEKAQEKAAHELEEAEAAVERGDEGAEERLALAEERLDEAMEAVVDAKREEDEADGAGNGDEDDDLFCGGEGKSSGGDDDEEEEEEDEDFWEAAARKKKEQQQEKLLGKEEGTCDEAHDKKAAEKPIKEKATNALDENGDDGFDDDEQGEERIVDQTVKDPLNFSLVDTSLPSEEIKEKYPNFSMAKVATTVVSKGEALYLPASWFHEVTSYSSCGNDKSESSTGEGRYHHHMAFNYWFHPPDGDSFKTPYAKPFWVKDWALRKLDG